MILADVSVRRPVFAMVVSLLLTIIGLMAASRLAVREVPNVQPSHRQRRHGLSGCVRGRGRIEDHAADRESDRRPGRRRYAQVLEPGRARITIEFSLDRDIESAANDVRDRVARVADDLPVEAEAPEVAKVDTTAEAVIWLNLSSEKRSPLELTDFAQRALPLTDLAALPFKVANGDSSVSPDGKKIAFVSALDRNIWLIDLEP